MTTYEYGSCVVAFLLCVGRVCDVVRGSFGVSALAPGLCDGSGRVKITFMTCRTCTAVLLCRTCFFILRTDVDLSRRCCYVVIAVNNS